MIICWLTTTLVPSYLLLSH